MGKNTKVRETVRKETKENVKKLQPTASLSDNDAVQSRN
jgi:hypothetical protein